MKTNDPVRLAVRKATNLVCVVAVSLCSGCLLVLPKTTTTSTTLGTKVTKTERGPVGPIELRLRGPAPGLVVGARRRRVCVEHLADVVEITKRTKAEITGIDPGSADNEIVAAILVFTLPVTVISALATAATMAGDGNSTTRQLVASGTRRVDCSVPAEGQRVSLTLPSGRILEGVTNARGLAGFSMPAGEPPTGTIVASSKAALPKVFRYSVDSGPLSRREVKEALQSVRPALLRCGRDAGYEGWLPLSIVFEDGHAYVAPNSLTAGRFASCTDRALHSVIVRSAPRIRFKYPVSFGHRRAPEAPPQTAVAAPAPTRPPMPASELRRLRKACAEPIAMWRAKRETDLPAECWPLVTR